MFIPFIVIYFYIPSNRNLSLFILCYYIYFILFSCMVDEFFDYLDHSKILYFNISICSSNCELFLYLQNGIILSTIILLFSIVCSYSLQYNSICIDSSIFYSFICLFSFYILILIVSDSPFILLFSQEGIGMSSILLICYYRSEQYIAAGYKIPSFHFHLHNRILFYSFCLYLSLL